MSIVGYPHVNHAAAGGARISGTNVPVRRLWQWHMRGVSVETLLKRYPSISPAAVLCALAFAYENAQLIEAEIANEKRT